MMRTHGITENVPYTYLISWSKTGMKYYGVRYAKDCHPSDLWVKYFTSSGHVSDYVSVHGNPDIIQVRKVFRGDDRVNEAKRYEHRVLCKLNVASRSDFLNKSNMNSLDTTKLDDPDVRARWAQSMISVRNDPKTKAKRRTGFQQRAEKKAETDPRVYKFVNKNTGEITECSVTRLSITYDLNITNMAMLIEGTRKSVKGWQILDNISPHGHADKTIYFFKHTSGNIEKCTRKELEKKYNINSGNLCGMIKGRLKSVKGWCVINTR